MTTYTAHEILGGVYEKTVKMTVDRRLRYISSNPSGAVVRQYGRDWIDPATGEVVYAGGATV